MNFRWGLILIHIGTYRCVYHQKTKQNTNPTTKTSTKKMQITPQNADHETTKQKQKSTYHATERNTTKTRILPQTKAQNTQTHTHTQMQIIPQTNKRKIKSQIRPETSKQNETQVMPQEKHTKNITSHNATTKQKYHKQQKNNNLAVTSTNNQRHFILLCFIVWCELRSLIQVRGRTPNIHIYIYNYNLHRLHAYVYIYIFTRSIDVAISCVIVFAYECNSILWLPEVLGRMDGPSSCPQLAGWWLHQPTCRSVGNLSKVLRWKSSGPKISRKTWKKHIHITYMLSTSNLQRTAPTTTKRQRQHQQPKCMIMRSRSVMICFNSLSASLGSVSGYRKQCEISVSTCCPAPQNTEQAVACGSVKSSAITECNLARKWLH